jgi:CSLREA domain-containing protein
MKTPRIRQVALAIGFATSLAIGGEAAASLSGRGGGAQTSGCPGDCDENDVVALDELVGAVRIALGQQDLAECQPADGDGDQRVGVNDLVSAVDAAVGSCSAPLTVHGRCVRPGPQGLVPCDEDVVVRVLRCDDPARCLENPTDPGAAAELATTQISTEGRFNVSFPSGAAGSAALIFTAQVEPVTTYRTINFGTVGPGGGSGLADEEILIGPSSEAAVRLMADSDFSSFSPEEVADLLAAVEAANESTNFSNLAPEAAARRAEAVASADPEVMMIIEEALHTPTATSTRTPTSNTPTPSPTSSTTPTPTDTPPEGGGLRVTKAEDSNDGVCDADCSLREAITAADANPGPDQIDVPAGTYRLTVAVGGRTRLFLSTDVNIIGAGRNMTIIDGNDTGSVFAVQSATVRIADLTVSNGTADLDDGGGIFNAGTLTLERVSVVNNIAVRFGGGIFNSESDSLTLLDSVVTQNRADRGGGIYNDVLATLNLVDSTIGFNNASRGGGLNNAANGPDSMAVNRCTIHLNGATGDGGGVYGRGTFVNATISGNAANGSGAGIFALPGTTLSNVTITDNFAQTRGGGISGTATIANTLIAGNRGGGNCDDTLTSRGHNLVAIGSSSSGCELDTVGPGDITADVDPLLDRLADNGGPTMTHAPLDASPAVDAGDPSPTGSSEAACAPIDQRGVARPQGSSCDIGAYEAVQGGGALAVTKTQDSNDGVCDADCSLREAITVANGRFGQDVITVPAGNYVLTLGPQGFTALVLSGDLIINGAGANQTILDGFQFTRVLRVEEDHVVRLSDLTVRNGFGQDGGGISNQGALTLERVVVSDNQSISGRGGGILNLGTLTVLDSTITRNVMGGAGDGGGIANSGELTVTNTTISSNRVTRGGRGGGVSGAGTFINCAISDNAVSDDSGSFGGEGGGLNGGPLTIVDSTISNNSASDGGGISCGSGLSLTNVTINDNVAGGSDFGGGRGGQGGGIYCLGALTLRNVTISNNTAQDRDASQGEGGGIYGSELDTIFNNVTITANTASIGGGIASGGPSLSNTVIAGNNGSNCFDFIGTSLGHNFVAIGEEEFDCFLVGGTGDITADIDPGLGPLADNDGPTMTHALLDGSPAINGGDPAAPGSGGSACEANDQRGVARPRQGRCDIGAFESDLLPPAGVICATASEGQSVTLECTDGVILEIQFASYGTPSGTCGQFSIGGCHAVNSSDAVSSVCVGLSDCSVPAINEVFGDPCFGAGKALFVQARCGIPSGLTPPPGGPTDLLRIEPRQ